MDYIFDYDIDKSVRLKKQRNITFDEIIVLINEGMIVDILEHPKSTRYPGQKIYVIDIDDYLWLVPYVQEGNKIFLKTAFPSRKTTKEYRRKKNELKIR